MYRRRYRRRRPYRRRRYRRGGGNQLTYWNMGKKVARDVWRLKQMVNVEYKNIDTAPGNKTCSSTANLILLNPCSRGDDATDRDGRQIRMKSVYLKGSLVIHASATATWVKIALVCQKEARGTLLTTAQVYETEEINALRELDNRRDVFILWDRVFRLNSDNSMMHWEKYFKIDMKTVFNSGNAGTIADIESNALYLYILSNEATNTPTCNVSCRIRFIDN